MSLEFCSLARGVVIVLFYVDDICSVVLWSHSCVLYPVQLIVAGLFFCQLLL